MSADAVDDIEVFYRDRVSKIDEERLKITKYISIIKPSQRERHTLEWDSKQLTDAALKVDYDLCNINDDHRGVTMQNQETRAELLSIARRHTANQSQIQQLAQISQPVERDITYFFDRKYSLITPECNDGRKSSNTTIQKPKIVRAGQGEVPPRSQNTLSTPKQVAANLQTCGI